MAKNNERPGYSEMIQRNADLQSATTQYQGDHPGMSREEAFGNVTKVSPQALKNKYKKNPDGSYTIK